MVGEDEGHETALPMTSCNAPAKVDEELELELYTDGEISSSSSWSTVPGSSPVTLGEDTSDGKAVSDEATPLLLEANESDDNDDVSSSRNAAGESHHEEGCSSAIMPVLAPESCPVFGGLFCGSYDLDEVESVRRLSASAAAVGRDWRVEDEDCNEEVAPLPLFFVTRFRTLDAEQRAQPASLDPSASTMDSSCQSTTDWYDMFAWLTLGSMSDDSRSSLSPTSWNGHLSLGPDLPSNAWKARRIRRKRRQSTGQMLAPSCIQRQGNRQQHSFHPIPSSLDPSQAQFSSTSDAPNTHSTLPMRQLIRPLPIVPVNRPGQEDWEMIFLSVCLFGLCCWLLSVLALTGPLVCPFCWSYRFATLYLSAAVSCSIPP